MAEIIETLMSNPVGAGAPTFTVDTSQTFVPIVNAVSNKFFNCNGFSNFQGGDNLVLISCGLIMPQGFSLTVDDNGTGATSQKFAFTMALEMSNLINTIHPPFTGLAGGRITLPFDNYELSIGQFCLAPITDFIVTASSLNSAVSMVNVPSALNGKTFGITMFIKILHNFPLV